MLAYVRSLGTQAIGGMLHTLKGISFLELAKIAANNQFN